MASKCLWQVSCVALQQAVHFPENVSVITAYKTAPAWGLLWSEGEAGTIWSRILFSLKHLPVGPQMFVTQSALKNFQINAFSLYFISWEVLTEAFPSVYRAFHLVGIPFLLKTWFSSWEALFTVWSQLGSQDFYSRGRCFPCPGREPKGPSLLWAIAGVCNCTIQQTSSEGWQIPEDSAQSLVVQTLPWCIRQVSAQLSVLWGCEEGCSLKREPFLPLCITGHPQDLREYREDRVGTGVACECWMWPL